MAPMPPVAVPATTQVVIIGAGQAGLAVAYHLVKRGFIPGRDLVILDGGPTAGGAWQHRWDALTLGDTHHVHDLPGMHEVGLTFAQAPADRPAREVVASYFARFEQHFGLHVARPVTVSRVDRVGGDFRVHGDFRVGGDGPVGGDTRVGGDASRPRDGGAPARTGTGPIPAAPPPFAAAPFAVTAPVVVSATGTWGAPRLPVMAGRDRFRGLQVTTATYPGAADFTGLRVAVVGGGSSALTILDELGATAAQTMWFTRRVPSFHADEPELSTDRGRIAVALQDEAARSGRALPSIVSVTGIPRSPLIDRLSAAGLLRRLPMFVGMNEAGLVLADGTQVEADAVVWATGFRPAVNHLVPLGVVNDAGAIEVADGAVPGAPGLFLAGYGPQASTITSNRAARVTARSIAQHLGERQASLPSRPD